MTVKKPPKSLMWYGKKYTLHGVYPSLSVAEDHAIYLRAGALFQGYFKVRIKRTDDDRFAVYKYRIKAPGRKKK